MPWLMEQKIFFPVPDEGREYSYAEIVEVRKGIAWVETQGAVYHLEGQGYRVIGEWSSNREFLEMEPQQAINLSRSGLGPLKRLNDKELDELQEDLKVGGTKAQDAIDLALAAAAPKAGPQRPNGITGDDARRLLGVAHLPSVEGDKSLIESATSLVGSGEVSAE